MSEYPIRYQRASMVELICGKRETAPWLRLAPELEAILGCFVGDFDPGGTDFGVGINRHTILLKT